MFICLSFRNVLLWMKITKIIRLEVGTLYYLQGINPVTSLLSLSYYLITMLLYFTGHRSLFI